MGAFSNIVNSMLGNATEGYKEAVKQRQQTGRMTTGGTGYSNKQTRALQFAQDVARGWSAQALGDSMTNRTPSTAQAVKAAQAATQGIENGNNYTALDSLDKAKRRSEGLLVNEENKKRADEYWNNMAGVEQIANGISNAVQTYAGAKMKGFGQEVENSNTPFSTNTSN
jgi:hypothetical protein